MTVKKLQIKKRDISHRPPQASELTEIVTQEDTVRLNVSSKTLNTSVVAPPMSTPTTLMPWRAMASNSMPCRPKEPNQLPTPSM